MKAVQISKTGGPEVLELKEITLNKPAANEVMIEHKAIGLNYIDTYHRSGLYPLKLPTNIGAEGAGIIKEKGFNSLSVAATHGIFSDGSIEELKDAATFIFMVRFPKSFAFGGQRTYPF